MVVVLQFNKFQRALCSRQNGTKMHNRNTLHSECVCVLLPEVQFVYCFHILSIALYMHQQQQQ